VRYFILFTKSRLGFGTATTNDIVVEGCDCNSDMTMYVPDGVHIFRFVLELVVNKL